MRKPTITCVIPAYNREGSVGRAIRSALHQSCPPERIIVIDDGSSDKTREIAQGFGTPVTCITQSNAGGAEARNRGAREAQTEWVAFLDSDDYWTPTHLEKTSEAIVGTHGKADFYFANVRRTLEEGGREQWEQARFQIQEAWKLLEDGRGWVLRPRIPMMLQATVFHRDRFLQKGGIWTQLKRRHDTHCFLSHGTGHPICAVNSIGTEMTADEDTSNRLTGVMDPDSLPYWKYSTQLWGDLEKRLPNLTDPERQLLEFRLFTAHWRLARLFFRSGKPWSTTVNLLDALRVSPRSFVRKFGGRSTHEKDAIPSNAIEEGLPE